MPEAVTIQVQAIGGKPRPLCVQADIQVRHGVLICLPWLPCYILDDQFCRHTCDLFPLRACSQVKELRHLISRELRFPNDCLKLIRGGSPLEDNAGHAGLADGGRMQCTAPLPVRLACFSRLCRRPVRLPEHALPVTPSTFRLATALLCRCAPGAHPTPSASQASAGSV